MKQNGDIPGVKGDKKNKTIDNRRNGYSKDCKYSIWRGPLEVQRDRNGEFQPIVMALKIF